jgi:hypothetical protein
MSYPLSYRNDGGHETRVLLAAGGPLRASARRLGGRRRLGELLQVDRRARYHGLFEPAAAGRRQSVERAGRRGRRSAGRRAKPAAAPQPDNGNVLQERIRALEQQVQALQTPASTPSPNYAAPYPAQLPPPTHYYPPPDYYPPPSYPSAYPSPMYGYGYPYYAYAASYVVVEPGSFVRPMHEFGGFRFGVHPMPLTQVMGVTYRR